MKMRGNKGRGQSKKYKKKTFPIRFDTGGMASTMLPRETHKIEVYVHELIRILREIKKGIPLGWGMNICWTFTCLIWGPILQDAIINKDNSFNFKNAIITLPPFLQILLAGSILGSIVFFTLSKYKNTAVESIEEILKQCGHNEPKRSFKRRKA